MKRFRATLEPEGPGLFFAVPFDVKAAFGEARPPVVVRAGGYEFRTRVMVYGGKFLLGMRKAQVAESGLRGGETVSVTLERDEAPRTVAMPRELAPVRRIWERLSYTRRREIAVALASAKKPQTRARRLQRAILELRALE